MKSRWSALSSDTHTSHARGGEQQSAGCRCRLRSRARGLPSARGAARSRSTNERVGEVHGVREQVGLGAQVEPAVVPQMRRRRVPLGAERRARSACATRAPRHRAAAPCTPRGRRRRRVGRRRARAAAAARSARRGTAGWPPRRRADRDARQRPGPRSDEPVSPAPQPPEHDGVECAPEPEPRDRHAAAPRHAGRRPPACRRPPSTVHSWSTSTDWWLGSWTWPLP